MAKKERPITGKNLIFICQISDAAAKIIKCQPSHGRKSSFSVLKAEIIPLEAEEDKSRQKLIAAFKALGYSSQPLIISIPRNQATSKYLKVPATTPEEIEKIVGLQAARYLPYPAKELITGFQILSSDKDGFTNVNLVIAHRDAISRYIKISEELKSSRVSVFLSSYGLCNLYNYLAPKSPAPVMLVDIGSGRAELAISRQEALFFSRSFKFSRAAQNWQAALAEEINKTRDTYAKDVAKDPLQKIIILRAEKDASGTAEAISSQLDLPVEEMNFSGRINLAQEAKEKVCVGEYSFSSLIGLGLSPVSGHLNLLPEELKQAARAALQRKSKLRLIIFLLAIAMITALATAKNLDNKEQYLAGLREELNKISSESRPLEEIEKRFKALESYAKRRLSGLDVLYELYKNTPGGITLANFSYEEEGNVLIHGMSPELNLVPEFIARLEKSPAFADFQIRIKYASKKKTSAGEVMDFEISCEKGK